MRAWHVLLVAALLVLSMGATTSTVSAARPSLAGSGSAWIVSFGGATDTPRRALGVARQRSLDRTVTRTLGRLGIRPQQRYRSAIHGFAATLTDVQLRALRADPNVRAIQPDRDLVVGETGPGAGVDATAAGGVRTVRLTSQRIPAGIRRVRATDSSIARIDGHDDRVDVDVAILDTGIAPHPDLNVRGGFDCLSDTPDAIRDRNGHGTHVAGIIGAIDDAGGVVGMAPGARLWSVRVADDHGRAKTSWYLCGVDWVMAQRDPSDPSRPRMEVVNMSVSGLLPERDDRDCGAAIGDALHQAICASVADGTTYVVAAGNQSTDAGLRLPAAYDEVITVAAIVDYDGKPGGLAKQSAYCPWYSADADDTYGDFSNFGPDVDILAPGKCVLSTYLRGTWGYMTGTSMATPTVAGAAALLAAEHPGIRPGQVRAALRAAASTDWRRSTVPADTTDLLLDVRALGAPPTFALAVDDESRRVGRGGRLEIPVAITHRHGHRAAVRVSVEGLPVGVSSSVRSDPDGAPIVVLSVTEDADTGNREVVIRGTDGELARSIDVGFRIVGGTRVERQAPTGGPFLTDGGVAIPVAFSLTAATDDAVRVRRQWAPPSRPGSCSGAAWQHDGPGRPAAELDPAGGTEGPWSFQVPASELSRGDGCYRWLIRLVDGDGLAATWISGTALLDTRTPGRPALRATGPRSWQARANQVVWVRAGTGSLRLEAAGGDSGSGAVRHAFGPLSASTGWDWTPATVDDDPAERTLRWTSAAVATSVGATTTDATGRTGAERRIDIRVDATKPSAAAWASPTGFRRTFGLPELKWRAGTDSGSGWATRQSIQQQRGKVRTTGSCAGVTWANDGEARLLLRSSQPSGLRSGYCYRWKLTALDRVGNRGPTRTSGTALFDGQPPIGDFRNPDEGTTRTQSGSTRRLTWTESDAGRSGGLRRTLERERKSLAADGRCTGLMWRPDGPSRSVRSGYTDTGLKAGSCYRWRLILEDGAGNVTTVISGIVKRRPA